TDEPDEFIMDTLGAWDGKDLKSVSDEDALPQTDEEKAVSQQKTEDNQDVLAFVKEALGDRIKEARISKILKSGAVCLTADGPVTLEMEKYFAKMDPMQAQNAKAQRVLELNPDSGAFAALRCAVDSDKDLAKQYAQLLYGQSLLIAGLPLEDPAAYAELVCSLMK
ncbi:MAG: molecular chaperone HtpG, partial [Pseudoflavonifractor sp.]